MSKLQDYPSVTLTGSYMALASRTAYEKLVVEFAFWYGFSPDVCPILAIGGQYPSLSMEKAVDNNRAQMDMGLGFVDLQEY